MRHKLISLNVLIDEAFSDLGLDANEFNIHILKRMGTDIYREVSTTEQLSHKIILLETNAQGKIELPNDFNKIEHVAYRIKKDKYDCTRRETVKEWVQSAYNCGGEKMDVTITVEGDECVGDQCAGLPVIIEVDHIWEKANPWYYSQSKMAAPKDITHEIQKNRSSLTDKFTLMSYSGNSFFRLQYHVENCENLHCLQCKYKYAIEYPYILTDLPKETEVLISYLAELTDEKGDVLIPDEVNTVECIKEGILAKHFRVRFLETGDKKYQFFYQDAEQKYNAAIGRAKSVLGSPEYQKFRTFLSETWTKRVRNTSATGSISGTDPYQTHLK